MIDTSREWENIDPDEAPAARSAGLVVAGNGALYKLDPSPATEEVGGVRRSIFPLRLMEPPEPVKFESFSTAAELPEGSTLESLRASGEGPVTLFAVETSLGAGVNRVMIIEDALSAGTLPPQVISPAEDEQLARVDEAIIKWARIPGAEGYQYQVSQRSDFRAVVASGSVIPALTWEKLTDLEEGTRYWWRVRLYDEDTGAAGPWSEPASFITALETPELSIPQNGETGVAVVPSFVWQTVDGATAYRFQLSIDGAFATTLMDETLLRQTSVEAGVALELKTIYFWRVKALSDVAESEWATFAFTTSPEPLEVPPITISPKGTPGETVVVPSVEPSPMPAWAWVVIGLVAVLLMVTILLIVRSRV